MKTQDYVAKQTREIVGFIEHTVARTPVDRLFWQPLDNGRSIHDQVVECASLNMVVTQALRERKDPIFDSTARQKFYADHDTMEKAMAVLSTSAKFLISAIESFPNGKLDDEVLLPFAGGMKRNFAWLLGMPYWNMTYHLGQINYIQTLYGDRDMT